MAKTLLVLRHGRAEPPSIRSDDRKRPLKNGGKRDAQRMGVWLAANGLLPDTILASPAERALNTARKACKSAGLDGDLVITDDRLYAADDRALLKILGDLPESAQTVLLVGHNPALSELVGRLAGKRNQAARRTDLVPGSLARLSADGSWSELGNGDAVLDGIVDPSDLPRGFPYPSPHGSEQRPRPAYYYRQSAVLPYRRSDAGMEVLLISSSSGRHWVVPKGIHDPGKTAQASAAQEALEEAGVIGEVGETAIGSYRYGKWDAVCDVSVYPMRVTRELTEAEWEEQHRSRQWLPAEKATALVKNPDIAALIRALPAKLGLE